MASDNLRPEEWPDLVRMIQEGHPNIGQRLVDRERRFDNFFATGQYKPTATAGAALTGSTVATETWGEWIRFGRWVFVQAQFRSTSAGTASNRILLSVPPELLIAGPVPGGSASIFVPRGQFIWEDDSTAPDGIVTGTAVPYGSTHIAGITSGIFGAAETFIYIGEGATSTVASGDWVAMSVMYLTSANPTV